MILKKDGLLRSSNIWKNRDSKAWRHNVKERAMSAVEGQDELIMDGSQATKRQAKMSPCTKPRRHMVGLEVQCRSLLTSLLGLASWHGRFTPKQTASAPTEEEAGVAPEPVLEFWRKEKSRHPAGQWTTMSICWSPSPQPNHRPDWASPAPGLKVLRYLHILYIRIKHAT